MVIIDIQSIENPNDQDDMRNTLENSYFSFLYENLPYNIYPKYIFTQQLYKGKNVALSHSIDIRCNLIMMAPIPKTDNVLYASYRAPAWDKAKLFHSHQKKLFRDEKVLQELSEQELIKRKPKDYKMAEYNGDVAWKGELIAVQVVRLGRIRSSGFRIQW